MMIQGPQDSGKAINRLQRTLKLAGHQLKDSQHQKLLQDFISDNNHAPIYVYDSDIHLKPPPNGQSCMFIRRTLSTADHADHFTFGSTVGNSMAGLQSVTDQILLPLLNQKQRHTSSEGSQELKSQLYRFMSDFSDGSSRLAAGSTILYIPNDRDETTADSSHIRRLELVVTKWIRQVKSITTSGIGGRKFVENSLLKEVDFWQRRYDNLESLNRQMDTANVKDIIRLLQGADSKVHLEFLQLSIAIADGTHEAEENLKVLPALIDPCQKLKQADMKVLPSILIQIMVTLRVIVQSSPSYNSQEKLVSLYRVLGSDVASRCSEFIFIDSLVRGETESCRGVITAASSICSYWMEIFSKFQEGLRKSEPIWKLTSEHVDSIFSPVKAFVQRCDDLEEVILYQTHFSRMKNGAKCPPAAFGSTSGRKISNTLSNLDEEFTLALDGLFRDRSATFDIRRGDWHIASGVFRRKVKELETKFLNAVSPAFDEATTIDGHARVLLKFASISLLPSLQPELQKRSKEFAKIALRELANIKSSYEKYRLTPEILRAHADISGSAYWALTLKRRVDRVYCHYQLVEQLLCAGDSSFIQNICSPLAAALNSFNTAMQIEWSESCPSQLLPTLAKPLLVRNAGGTISSNFPSVVSTNLLEGELWARLKCEIVPAVHEIQPRKVDLQNLRHRIIDICREYNSILATIPKDCLGIFAEKLRNLDKKLSPGFVALTWITKGNFEMFFREFKKAANEVRLVISKYFEQCAQLLQLLNLVSATDLCVVEPKRVYSLDEFVAIQSAHRTQAIAVLFENQRSMQRILADILNLFNYGNEAPKAWQEFIQRTDALLENSMKVAVKNSLLSMTKAINGEGSLRGVVAPVFPVFQLEIVLENQKVEFLPPLPQLDERINMLSKLTVDAILSIPSLANVSYLEASKRASSRQAILREKDVSDLLSAIQSGMAGNSALAQDYIRNWDKYREIWEINKDAFIRRYAKLKPPTSTFDADLGRYHEVANNAQKEETFANINFIRIDCSSLKRAIVGHCSIWQEKLSTLLCSNASADLKALYDNVKSNTLKLQLMRATDLNSLSELAALCASQKEDLPNIQARFAPIHEQYKVLEKFEVQPKEEDQQSLDGIQAALDELVQAVADAEERLELSKLKLKNDLLTAIRKFTESAAMLREEFTNSGLFNNSFEFARVRKSLEAYQNRAQLLLEEEKSLRKGMLLFRIDQAPSKDVEWLLCTLLTLKQLYAAVEEWHIMWTTVKQQSMVALVGADLERDSDFQQKRFAKFAKDCKDWPVYVFSNDLNDQIIRFVPLLKHLQNPNMKQRHWAEISTLVGTNCNPFDSDFNLERMLESNIAKFAVEITIISEASNK